MTLHNLNERQWHDLARRVSHGIATCDDADFVEKIGLKAQAMRIRTGMSTHSDAVLINLQSFLQLQELKEAA